MKSLILLFTVAFVFQAHADNKVIHCASTNTADKGAYELLILETNLPDVKGALIFVDGELKLSFLGHLEVSNYGLYFQSQALENPNLPQLEVEIEGSCGSCLRRADVRINSPKYERLFSDTGIRRLSSLVCR